MRESRKAASVEDSVIHDHSTGVKRKRGNQNAATLNPAFPLRSPPTNESQLKTPMVDALTNNVEGQIPAKKSGRKRKPVEEFETVETEKKKSPIRREGRSSKLCDQEQASVPSVKRNKEADLANKGNHIKTKQKKVSNGPVTEEERQDIKIETIPHHENLNVNTTKSKSRKDQKTHARETAVEQKQETDGLEPQKPKKKNKTKEEKEAEAMPLAVRTTGLKMFVGAHTSIAKGVENAVTNCVHVGGNAFAMFLKSQRRWENPALKDENRDAFRKHLIDFKYDGMSHIVPHGSYLVNLATADDEKGKQSYEAFIDDLHRCEALGIRYYNFHPGSAGQSPLTEAIERLAKRLNRALSETETVTPLLENMAGHGSLIGGCLTDLRDVITLIEPQYKSRIGVCIDTCHAFASGYDLRTPESFQKTLTEFDTTVGMKYLKALHLNDSKAPFNSKRDLHQNIGLGFLGLQAFHNVMNEPRFENLPLILETPCDRPDPSDPKGKKSIEDKSIWAREIKLLESLTGMDSRSDEFKKLEQELSDHGKEEREKMQTKFDTKIAKAVKKLEKEREKGQKSVKDMFSGQKRKISTVRDLAEEMSDELSEEDAEEDVE